MIDEIIRDFKWYYNNGYITARDGNACFRKENNFCVTASGVDKGDLSFTDFLQINDKLETLGNTKNKPSIETAAHLSALSKTGKLASVHVHSPNTVALFKLFHHKETEIENILNNNWPELCRYTKVGVTAGFYAPGSNDLHNALSNSFQTKPDIVILQQHGVLAVGNSMSECKEHIFRLEHVSSILLKIAAIDIKFIK